MNTADTSEFTDLPSGWSTASGYGSNLVTQDVVDDQGPHHGGNRSRRQRDLRGVPGRAAGSARLPGLEQHDGHDDGTDAGEHQRSGGRLQRDADHVGDAERDGRRTQRQRGDRRRAKPDRGRDQCGGAGDRGGRLLQPVGADVRDGSDRHAGGELQPDAVRLRRRGQPGARANAQRDDLPHGVRQPGRTCSARGWGRTTRRPAGTWSPTNNDRHGEHGADQRQRVRQRRGGRRPADAGDRRRRQRDDEHVQFRRPAAQRDGARSRAATRSAR